MPEGNSPPSRTVMPASAPVLFIYLVTPSQVYTDSDDPVSLSVSVFNPKSNGPVAVTHIEFAISIGTGQNDLSDDWKIEQQSNQTTWQIERQPYNSSPVI